MRDRWRIWAQGVFLVALLGCGSSRPPALGDTNGDPDASLGGPCSPGRAGCSCSMDGATVACGSVYIKTGTYVTCSMGRSACAGGVWGPCIGNVIVSKSLAPPPAHTTGGLHFTALGTGGPCAAGSNPCDPNCNQTTDDPTSGFTAPAGFTAGPSGLSLSGTGGVSCTSLTVTPSKSAVTVTDLTTPVPITLTATAVPAGCATSPYATTWTVDDADQATISGSMNNNGVLTLQTPLPGTMNVTAYAAGTTGTAVITIKLNIVDTTGVVGSESPSSATQYGKFYTGGVITGAPLPGTTASTASWLYPYANTYLPLALPAPVVMYKYAVAPGTSPNSAIKLSLRYPAGATEAASIFNYATVVTELTPDPQVYTLQAAWQRFEQTARGTDASLVLQRWTGGGGGVLENETLRTIHFVDGQLKGTVFYQSYSSPLGGQTGAILRIAPGASAPTLAVQPGGNCTVCHTLNSDGSTMIAQDGIGGGSTNESTSKRYNIAGGGAPSPPVLNSYPNVSGTNHDATGDKFDFGAPWKDGHIYMTHGGSGTGDIIFHAPPASSKLYDPANAATAKVVTGWANDEEATAPKFSPDGTKLAFGFWGGTGLAQSPAGTLASDVNGTTLAVVDFSCNAGCTANWAVANARALMTPATVAGYRPLSGGATFHVTNGSKNVTASGSLFTVELGGPPDKISFSAQPGVAYTVSAIGSDTSLTLSANYTGATSTTSTAKNPALVSWPSFLPDGSAVIFQRQVVSSKAAIAWTTSDVNTTNGAQADLWISDVTANSATASTPVALNALNGLDSGGMTYLPKTSRTVAPPTDYHSGGLSYTVYVAEHCDRSGTAKNIYDYQLSYLPSVCPVQAGGFNWVVFTSRRLYGNLAYSSPWDAVPLQSSGAASPASCYSGTNSPKKLWVAAIDGTYTPGTDPSHPAFYLPGQELPSGNAVSSWVTAPCAAVGSSCVTSDDCCGGTGGSPTTLCKITTAPSTKTCQNIGGACAAAGSVCNTPGSPGDCCTGLTCPGAGGKCINPSSTSFMPNTYTREFVAACPSGTRVIWRFFQWQSTIPANTSIAFSAQTKELVTDTYAPVGPLGIGTASATTPGVTWGQGPQTVDAVLVGAGLVSRPYLLVTMAFNPDAGGTVTPTLKTWQQNYDCVAAE